MVSEARKLHVIEEVLKIDSDALLAKVEAVLKNAPKVAKTEKSKLTINDFVGILSRKEATEMRKAIAETCETIDENDWK